MSVDVTAETRIAVEPAGVADFAMDPSNDTKWIGALKSVRQLDDRPIGMGVRVERVASFLGKRIEYVNEIVEHEPGRRLVMRSIRAPFPMTVTYHFSASEGGTVVRIRAQGDAHGFYRVTGPMLSFMVRQGIARDLRTLKRVLESKPLAA